jgi:hypothetical protein
MTDLSEQLRHRLADESPHRLAYYEALLNRIASEVGGNAKFHAERTASLIVEIDGLRNDMKAITERVDRMAQFLTTLKNGSKKSS